MEMQAHLYHSYITFIKWYLNLFLSLLLAPYYLNCSVVNDFSDTEKRAQYIEEERIMREENIRLQRKLQREVERREALCRQLSESESSLEMDDERYKDSDLFFAQIKQVN